MGMAASQARYLALVARKSNCEYEGQQINQSRLVLSNKSANLFSQMLGLQVPVPPSKQDFVKIQYSYNDGSAEHVITGWHQLSGSDSDDYNYLVDTEYSTNVYTGSQKLKTNPQVQFSGSGPSSTTSLPEEIVKIEDALKNIQNCQKAYKEAEDKYNSLVESAKSLTYFRDSSYNGLTSSSVTVYEDPASGAKGYTVKQSDTVSRNYISYETLSGSADDPSTPKGIVKQAVDTLISFGALNEGYSYENVYYDAASNTMAFKSDIENVSGGTSSILYTYHPSVDAESEVHGIANVKEEIDAAKSTMQTCKSALDIAIAAYEALDVPTYVGNYKLVALSSLSETEERDIGQIIKDMLADNITTNLTRCFDTVSGEYTADTYTGGIYKYEQGGATYYTTYYDLANSYINGSGINNIDNQAKLPVYTVGDVQKTIKSSEKALLETDSSGRFTSVRFENDSIVYDLSVHEVEDTVAYDDAMNQYDYNKALYDKRVAEINAQTELIHMEDQDLELRLKQLDTEQNALNTEIDAVSKVVKDNIEKSFKTFGG